MKSSKATAQKTRKNYRFKTDNSMIEPRSLFNGIKNLNDLSAI